jgi:intergrase/recombinase
MTELVPTLGAVMLAAVTAIFGILSYRNQKETDRQIELRNRRMKDYDAYLAAYYHYRMWEGVDKDKTDKAALEYQDAYRNLFQVASDRVLIAATDFNEFAWRENTTLTGEDYRNRFKELYATLILEMRRDAFEKTKLPRDLVEERLPWAFE